MLRTKAIHLNPKTIDFKDLTQNVSLDNFKINIKPKAIK
jgi:hypothetical protein